MMRNFTEGRAAKPARTDTVQMPVSLELPGFSGRSVTGRFGPRRIRSGSLVVLPLAED
jgi:hypothetical protein